MPLDSLFIIVSILNDCGWPIKETVQDTFHRALTSNNGIFTPILELIYTRVLGGTIGVNSSEELEALEEFTSENPVILLSPASTTPSRATMDRVIRLAINRCCTGSGLLVINGEEG